MQKCMYCCNLIFYIILLYNLNKYNLKFSIRVLVIVNEGSTLKIFSEPFRLNFQFPWCEGTLINLLVQKDIYKVKICNINANIYDTTKGGLNNVNVGEV